MKTRLLNIILCVLFIMVHGGLSGQSYCLPSYSSGNGSGDYISAVKIGSINNVTGKAPGPNYYSDFTALTATLVLNNSTSISITNGTYPVDTFAIWIDYNHDFDFSDPGELIGRFKSTAASQTNTINFTVPLTALTGSTRLRVRCIYNAIVNSCNTFTYGETEDYSVQIVPRFSNKFSITTNNGIYCAAVWTDVNNDGYLDALYTSGWLGTLHILKNTGGTTFSDFDTGLDGPKLGVIAPGDYNRDGNIDVLVSGTRENGPDPTTFFTKIYKNTGGTFTDIGAGLPGLYNSSADWGDFDNDGDLDLLISGIGSGDPVTKIYENKGSDVFVEYPALLKGTSKGKCKWWDFNNDGYLDIIVSGLNIDGNSEISVYRNNKGKGFTKIPYNFLNIPGSFDIGDYNQDGYPDIVIAGEENLQPDVNGNPRTVIYRNNGDETFTNINVPIQNLREADVKFGDADNDGKLDILLIGRYIYYVDKYIQLYKNKGNDIFELEPMSMTPVYGGKIDWGDYDNDNDLDFLYTGDDGYLRIVENSTSAVVPNVPPSPPTVLSSKMVGNGIQLKFNAGSDTKSLPSGLTYNLKVGTTPGGTNIVSPGSSVTTGRLKYTSIGNLNQNKNILISGLSTGTYYWSVQSIDQSYAGSAFSSEMNVTVMDPFTQISPGFPQVSLGKSEWADLNSDGKPDLIITGTTTVGYPATPSTSFWFKGTGDVFTPYSGNNTLEGVYLSSVSPNDYDGDNDVDVFIYGTNSSGQSSSKLYQNTGGNFTSVSHPFGTGGQAAFGDIDNDGDQDVVIANTVYIKTGPNTYTTRTIPDGNHILFDFDNDGYLDVLVFGYGLTTLEKNDGSGNFTTVQGTTFKGLYYASADVGDYNNDGYLDIVLTGYDNYSRYSYIYRNNGDGTFTDIQANIRAVESGRILWVDYDNDGDLDVSMTGASSTNITRIYLNKGNDIFEPITVNLPEYYDSDINWADYDNDGDMDLIYSGRIATPMITYLYRNNNNYPNPQPLTPGNLGSVVQGQNVRLLWSRSFNPSDTIETMSYNVRIGSTPGSCNVLAPQADLVSGKPFVHKLGNAQMVTFKIIKNLPVGKYYWSVESLDKNSNNSSWAPEQSFNINVLQADFLATTACIGQSTSFTDKSLTSGVTIDSWTWNFGDGTSSTLANPVHIYGTDGAFTVTLTIGSGIYSDNITKQVSVNKKPVAGFNADAVCQGTATSFTNTTNNNGLTISSWFWDFGDGQTSILQNPASHGYLGASNYTAILRAQASNGCIDEISKTVTIVGYPLTGISADGATTFCSGQNVTLSTPSNADYAYVWKRDGSSITGATINTYIAQISGSYTVSVTNKGLCTNLSSAIPVVVNNTPAAPLISATGPVTFCQGDSVNLSVTNTNGYSYQWKLNGGAVGTNSNLFTANSSGTYSLLVSNSSGCSANSTDSINVVVNPKPSLPTVNISGPTQFCLGESVSLNVPVNSDYSYQWQNNGSAISDASTNNYVAQNSGVYSLKISNSNGCSIKTPDVPVTSLPVPATLLISADRPSPVQFCQGESVNLSVTNAAGYTYQWKLNGGEVGSNSNQFVAKNEGTYSLIVSYSNGCSTAASNTLNIIVNSLPTVSAVNLSGPTEFCEGGSVNLSVTTNPAYTYDWRNELGLISNAKTSSYTATTSGKYQLDISNSLCVARTAPVNVVVNPSPVNPIIDKGNYTAGMCLGETPIRLKASTVTPGYTYQWFKNGVPFSSSSSSVVEGFLQAGIYKLEANLAGCKSKQDTLNVYFQDALLKPYIYVKGPTVWYLICSNVTASYYKWYYNGTLIPGADKYMYVPNQKLGKYNVSIANTNLCYTLSDTIKIPTGITGIEDVNPFADMIIYPNPTSGMFTLELRNQLFGEVTISILDQGGKEILNIRTDKTSEHFSKQIDLSGHSKGIYIINTNINKRLDNRKIIVK